MNPHNSIIILGPTASGKTRLATQLAHVLNGAVLSFDSRQVYRQLNIGSGKDLNEFKIGNHTIPYHLIDIADINENFHSCEFVKNYLEAYETCSLKKELPILCGGTGLYFDLVLKQYQYINIPNNEDLRKQLSVMSDEALLLELNLFPHQAISQADISTRKRIIRAIEIAEYLSKYKHDKISYPNIKPLIIGINLSSSERRKRIDDRLNDRLANGLIEEVENLL
jgi:tRNA dimethylallyltransferase